VSDFVAEEETERGLQGGKIALKSLGDDVTQGVSCVGKKGTFVATLRESDIEKRDREGSFDIGGGINGRKVVLILATGGRVRDILKKPIRKGGETRFESP